MADYTAPGIIIPSGWGSTWWNYTPTSSQTNRRAVVLFGDSTSFGSGGLLSWLTRVRQRAVAAGYADGGKGIFAGLEQELTYDAPEINGIVSSTFTGSADSFDTLVGSWLFDASGSPGHVHVSQFRETCLRLWYMKRNLAGTFTYSIKDASNNVLASGTIAAQQSGNPRPAFAYFTGLGTFGAVKTLTLTNTGTGEIHAAVDPINAAGACFQKQAMSGATFGGFFYGGLTVSSPYTTAIDGFRYQAPMGLTATTASSPAYTGATVDTTVPAGGAVQPVLAMSDLGFNDLSNAGQGQTPAFWAEYVKRFAGACTDAGVAGMILAGQLPYNASWPSFGPACFAALRDTAYAQGLAFVDHFYPIGGASLSYSGGTSNPHLTRTQYTTQADWLWDNVLAPTSAAAVALTGGSSGSTSWTPVIAERWGGSSWASMTVEEWNGSAWVSAPLERAT